MKVFWIVRQRYGRSPTDQMKDLDSLGDKMELFDVNAATGVYLCLSLFMLKFILGRIARKICDLPRINL